VLNELIGGNGFCEARLWQELRQKRGLVYSVGSSLKSDPQRGDLEIEMSAPPAKAQAAVDLVKRELRSLQNAPVGATQLQEAKTRLASSALLDEESASNQADELLLMAQQGLPTNYYATLVNEYAGISAADIQRVAKRYLRPSDLIEVFAGPSGPWAVQGL